MLTMKNLKKLIAIVSCAAIVLSFAACGKNDVEEGTTAAPNTTVAETTTNPLHNAKTRFSHLADMSVWTAGKKIDYKQGETKIMTATAALNDSVKNDKFAVSSKKITLETLETMKNKNSCIELKYEKDQTGQFTDKEVKYDKLFVATAGDNLNTIILLNDGKIVSIIDVTKVASDKTISENISSAVEVITLPADHTH